MMSKHEGGRARVEERIYMIDTNFSLDTCLGHVVTAQLDIKEM